MNTDTLASTSRLVSPRSRARLLVALSLLSCGTLSAQSTWSGGGGDNNWGTAANWDVSIANSFSTGLIFAGSTQLTNNNNLTGGTATSLTFSSGAGAFVLGGNAFTLGTGTAATSLTNSSGVTQTINNNLTLGNSMQTLALTSGGLTLGGTVGVAGANSGITLTGGNVFRVNTTSTLSGTSSQITLANTAGQRLVIGSGATVTGTLGGTGVVEFVDASSTFVQSRSGINFGGTFHGQGTIEFRVSGDVRFNVGVGTGGPYTVKLNMNTGLNSGGIYTNVNGTTRSNNFNVVGNGGYYRFNAGTETLSGAVTGNGQFNLRLNGAATGYNLTGDWTATNTFSSAFTGTLAISNNAGTVSINSANSSTATAAYSLANTGAILQTGNAITTANLGSLTGVSGSILRGNVVGTSTFSIGALNTSTTFAGAVTNGSTPGTMLTAITKVGTGTLTLTGANTFTGALNVNAGTVALSGSGSLATTTYQIGNGGTFDTSALAAYNLATVSTTVGVGSATAGFFNAGSGAVTLGGGLTFDFGSTTTPAASYNIFDWGSQTGDFASVTIAGTSLSGVLSNGGSGDLWTGTIGGYDFSFNEASGVLSAVSAIPEPSTYALLVGTLGLAGAMVRRRRRASSQVA